MAETKGEINPLAEKPDTRAATTVSSIEPQSEPSRPTISNNKTGQYSLLGEDEGGFQLTGGKAEDMARAANEELNRKNAHAESDAVKAQTEFPEQPTTQGEQPNATQTGQNENQLQHQGTPPRPAVSSDEGQVRPGNGEQAGGGGGPEPSAKGAVDAQVDKAIAKRPPGKPRNTNYGRPGFVVNPVDLALVYLLHPVWQCAAVFQLLQRICPCVRQGFSRLTCVMRRRGFRNLFRCLPRNPAVNLGD